MAQCSAYEFHLPASRLRRAANDGNPVTATTTFPSLPGQGTVAATEILGNALRLYGDARLLFDHERYASCASLSVLAIEELTKFMALAGFQPLQRSEWRRHPAKHLSPASFLLRNRYQAALREVIAERQLGEPIAVFNGPNFGPKRAVTSRNQPKHNGTMTPLSD
jgi:hypothetical protein